MAAVGVVLVGGRSTRMGTAKAHLEWHGSTLLRRTVGVLARGTRGPVVVVRAPGQALPALGRGVEVVEDAVAGRGPLQGLAVGLAAGARHGSRAFVGAVDLPFLHPAFVRRVLAALTAGVDVALPHADGHRQPLAAAYRTGLAGRVEDLLAAGETRPAALLERCAVHLLDEAALLADAALIAVDPALASLRNVNSPDEYAAARAQPPPPVTVTRQASAGARRTWRLRAATLGVAPAHTGVRLDAGVAVRLDGAPSAPDPQVPLAHGDVVAFGPGAAVVAVDGSDALS